MVTRRKWCMPAVVLMGGMFLGLPAMARSGQVPGVAEIASGQIREARRQAAHRKRRIVMDNDGNEPVYHLKETTAKALLDCRTTDLVGTQVDTIVYCTWSSGFGMFTHHTKIGQMFTCTEEGFSNNRTQDFLKQGLDPLRIVVEFCRKHDIEVFWSMRMNDTHDAWNAWYSSYMIPELKKQHPEYLVASRDKQAKVGGWTAVDYAHQEIRDLAVRYIGEVCVNYDVDGVVLDYFRHPVLFKSHAMGGVATQSERDMLTDMMRRVRQTADGAAQKRRRPILVTVRVPDSVDYCKAMGIDLVRWLEEGLIDLLAVSGYFRLNPWETSVALGHAYDVPVLACLSESRIKGEAGQLRKALPCYRARAINAWAAGVDGVYLFNFFKPRSSLWREIGDPVSIRPLERMYCTGARGTNVVRRWMVESERFLNRSPVSPENPRPLNAGVPVDVDLRVGEDPDHAGPAELSLELQTSGVVAPEHLLVKVNDVLLKGGVSSGSWLRFDVDPAWVRTGLNDVQIDLLDSADTPQKVSLQDLVLWVRPRR